MNNIIKALEKVGIDKKGVLEGWYNTINSHNLSDEQKDIAQKRADVCSTCEYNKPVYVMGRKYENGCIGCGCPFPQKFYSFRKQNTCPLSLWEK